MSVLGATVGALVAFVAVLTSLPPSIDALKDSAARAVLPDSDLTHVGANTGATIIVGWDRFAVADFTDDRPPAEVAVLLRDHLVEQGWTIESITANGFGHRITGSSFLTRLRVTVGHQRWHGERLDASIGSAVVSRDEQRRAVMFWSAVAAGGIAGGVLARQRRGRVAERTDAP